jgi:predicted nuclease of restriction endonuclease-like (RecB) superfamily
MPNELEKQIPEGYKTLREDIAYLLEKAKLQAYKAVDNIRVQTYWQIGERITREELKGGRAGYGKKVIPLLAEDLGFSRTELFRMTEFYKAYPIVAAVPQQLSWSHIRELIPIDSEEERRFYEVQAIKNTWSLYKLREQIKAKVYQQAKKEGQIITKLPLQLPEPEEVFKDTYHFDFLSLQEGHSEQELEDALTNRIVQTLLEMGRGFSFAGRQKKIIIDGQIHTVDLEFYNRELQCIVLAELKIERFKAEFVGQMNKYISYYRENIQFPFEKPTIGLIICAGKGKEEVHYALAGLDDRIFVAEYKTKLPSEAEIKRRLEEME